MVKRAFLIDPDGEVAHEWETGRGISEYDKSGKLVWRHDDPYQQHDARRLANGTIYVAFSELSDAEKDSIRGGVPCSETPGGPV